MVMLPKRGNMHVLCVVCFATVVCLSGAMPTDSLGTGGGGGGNVLSDYSPSYNFIDEYLRHNEQDLAPSDSQLGNLIWGLLYPEPTRQFNQWAFFKRAGAGNTRQQDLYSSYRKRQQAWHTDYGKRQQAWHTDYGKRQQKMGVGKRQQAWFTDYGKRQQAWHTDYGKRAVNDLDLELYGKPEVIDYLGAKNLLPLAGNLGSRGDNSFEGNDVSKRQQAWYTDYGKRQQSWHEPYGKRQ